MPTSAQPRRSTILDDLFREYQGLPLSIRLWNGWEWRSLPRQHSSVILTIKTPSALAALASTCGGSLFNRSFLQGEIDADGDIRTVFALVEFLLNRPCGFLGQLAHAITNRIPWPEHMLRIGYPVSRNDEFFLITHRPNMPTGLFRALLGDVLRHPLNWFRRGFDASLLSTQQRLAWMSEELPTRSLEHFLGARSNGYPLNSRITGRDLPNRCGVILSAAQAKVVQGFDTEAPDGLEWQIEACGNPDSQQRSSSFERIASLATLAHARQQSLSGFLRSVHGLLKADGLFLCYSVTISPRSRTGDRRGALLSLPRVVATAESAGFEVREVENLRLNEESPVHEWLLGLRNPGHTIAARLSDLSHRTWLLCLAGLAAPLRRRDVSIHQILLSRRE